MLIPLLLIALAPRDVDRVVVIRNDSSPTSVAVAGAYSRLRGVRSVLAVRCRDSAASTDRETIPYTEYRDAIEAPLLAYLAKRPLIDFIVTTRGVPIRISDAPGRGMWDKQPALDSYLAALGYDRVPGTITVKVSDSGFTGTTWANRFWNSSERFSHRRFGGYLVTRLDGYTQADAIALITRAIAAEKAQPAAPVLLDTCPGFGYSSAPQPVSIAAPPAPGASASVLGELSYDHFNADMRSAASVLRKRGARVELTEDGPFVAGSAPLAGYCSWGSNDQRYDAGAYAALRFVPGAIAETAVSTSARTFLPTSGGQSLIADLVRQGVTGVKGYTDEPLLQAVASPTVLFDRYTRGWTLAESFYAASRFVGWEDVVIGDPLCRPYGPAHRPAHRTGSAGR